MHKVAIFNSLVPGTKLVKITIAGHDWLDLSTVRIMYDLTNTDTAFYHKLCLVSVLGLFVQQYENISRWADLGRH